jgi:hypothetical protein
VHRLGRRAAVVAHPHLRVEPGRGLLDRGDLDTDPRVRLPRRQHLIGQEADQGEGDDGAEYAQCPLPGDEPARCRPLFMSSTFTG